MIGVEILAKKKWPHMEKAIRDAYNEGYEKGFNEGCKRSREERRPRQIIEC